MLKKIFGINSKEIIVNKMDLNVENSELSGLEKFKSKNADDRMKDVMILGDTGNPKVFEILEYVILNDTDSGVVMAALKRIHNFKGNDKLIPFLSELRNMESYEPYFSMALSRTGIITLEEFENKMNGTKNGQ